MRARLIIIGAATWLISSACADLRPCEAGFLNTVESAQWFAESAGAGSAAEQPRNVEPADDAPAIEFAPAVSAVVGEGSTSSAPTGNLLRITLGSTFAALVAAERPASIPAVERLQIVESDLIPLIHLSSVFRPPRA